MTTSVTRVSIAAAAAAVRLESLGVAHRVDEDVVDTEGHWFFEVDVTSDLVVFATVYAMNGEAALSIDVRSRAEGEPVEKFGEVDHRGLLPGATIAALIRGAAALAREGRRIG